MNINEKELNEMIEKMTEDWATNLILNKYQANKGIDEIINELNK